MFKFENVLKSSFIRELGLKLTVVGQSERSHGVELEGSNNSKWTVCESGQSKSQKLDGLKGGNWTVLRDESRQTFRVRINAF